jgi:hypothetical protein
MSKTVNPLPRLSPQEPRCGDPSLVLLGQGKGLVSWIEIRSNLKTAVQVADFYCD